VEKRSKMKKKGNWQIRPSTFFGIVFVLTLILIILPGPGILVPFVSIPIFSYLKKQKQIKEFKLSDLGLMALYVTVTITGLLYLQMISLVSVPWIKIIIVGMAADVIASIFGFIPVVGDIISSIMNLIMALTVVGGIEGTLIGMVLVMISLIPGPSLGANTLFLILFKIISEIII
jgi:hypothetical protein